MNIHIQLLCCIARLLPKRGMTRLNHVFFNNCYILFGETQSKRLQKLQNRAARVILGVSNDANHTIALHALGWEPVKIEGKKSKGKMIYKISNKMGSQSLINLFSYESDKTDYPVRDISSSLCLPITSY